MNDFDDLDDLFDRLRSAATDGELAGETSHVDVMVHHHHHHHHHQKRHRMFTSRRVRVAAFVAAGVIGFGGVAAAGPGGPFASTGSDDTTTTSELTTTTRTSRTSRSMTIAMTTMICPRSPRSRRSRASRSRQASRATARRRTPATDPGDLSSDLFGDLCCGQGPSIARRTSSTVRDAGGSPARAISAASVCRA